MNDIINLATEADRQLKWDKRFLELALHVAQWSKDPSSKVGAILVDKKRRIIGTGYNGFARGVYDIRDRYNDRDLKYKFVCHAEVNCILNAIKSTEGSTLYCTMFSCNECAKVIIQAGITRLVSSPPLDERWQASYDISKTMFNEAGVEYLFIE